MGTSSRIKPERLAKKLLLLRESLSLTQLELAKKLSSGKIQLRRSDISRYELGAREPSLIVLLRYSRLAKVSLETLVDDELDLSLE